MGQIRDAARTKARILEAAVEEFSARGYAGARFEGVARIAGVTKQLVAHYFPNREALFKAVLAENMRHKESLDVGGTPAADLFRQRFELALRERTWLKFVLWEAAEYANTQRVAEQAQRVASIRRQRAGLVELQRRGELAADADPAMLQLAILALASYPLTFAQVTRMVTGLAPTSPGFKRRWTEVLMRVGAAFSVAQPAEAVAEVPARHAGNRRPVSAKSRSRPSPRPPPRPPGGRR